MRTATQIVDAVARELLPSYHGMVSLDDVERRAAEFAEAAKAAEPKSPQRVLANACSEHLGELHRSLRFTAFQL